MEPIVKLSDMAVEQREHHNGELTGCGLVRNLSPSAVSLDGSSRIQLLTRNYAAKLMVLDVGSRKKGM